MSNAKKATVAKNAWYKRPAVMRHNKIHKVNVKTWTKRGQAKT